MRLSAVNSVVLSGMDLLAGRWFTEPSNKKFEGCVVLDGSLQGSLSGYPAHAVLLPLP